MDRLLRTITYFHCIKRVYLLMIQDGFLRCKQIARYIAQSWVFQVARPFLNLALGLKFTP